MNISLSIRFMTLATLVLLYSGPSVTAKELIRNGNFNDGSTHWTVLCTAIEAYASETSYGGSGSNQVAEIDDESCFYQDVCVLPGLDYRFEMKASRRTGNGAAASTVTTTLKIEGLDAANTVVATFVNMDFTRNNTSFALTPVTGIPVFQVPLGSGVVRLRVSLQDNTSGFSTLGMVIDDLSLVPVDTFVISGHDSVCQFTSWTFSVTNMPTSNIHYDWSFDSGATPASSTLPTPSVAWSTPGSKQVTCIIGNGVCFFDTLTFQVSVFPGRTTLREFTICPGVSIALEATTDPVEWHVAPGGSSLSSLSCTNCRTPVATPDQHTVYYAVSTSSGVCPVADTVVVNVDRDNTLHILPEDRLVVCRPDFIRPQVDITGPGPLQNLPCGPVTIRPSTPADTLEIDPYLAAVNTAPAGSMATPFPHLQRAARHQYIIRASDLRTGGMYSGTLTGLALQFSPNSGTAVMRDVRISLRCVVIDDFDSSSQFIAGATEVFYSSSVPIPSAGGYLWFPFTTFYNRDTGMNLLVDICYDNGTAVPSVPAVCATTPYYATLYDTAGFPGSHCTGTGASPLPSRDLPVFRFSYDLAPEAGWELQWGSGDKILSDGAAPEIFIRESTSIYVTTYNRNGCILTDTLEIYVPDNRIIPADTSVCTGERVQLQALNGETYQWYESGYRPATTLSCTQCPDPVATPLQDEEYTVVITDHGCADTFQAAIKVTPYPELEITPSDTTIDYSKHVRLRVKGEADTYLWTPGTSLDNPLGDETVARPEETTLYTVTGLPAGNRRCSSTASALVRINFQVPLFVPSAFTPNGDGRNDVFRVANFSFQKIVEFRVFNRWGEEVFHATDNKGWDGTWKGTPMAMDIYHYLIRVTIPDGSMETFKGDVTLVR